MCTVCMCTCTCTCMCTAHAPPTHHPRSAHAPPPHRPRTAQARAAVLPPLVSPLFHRRCVGLGRPHARPPQQQKWPLAFRPWLFAPGFSPLAFRPWLSASASASQSAAVPAAVSARASPTHRTSTSASTSTFTSTSICAHPPAHSPAGGPLTRRPSTLMARGSTPACTWSCTFTTGSPPSDIDLPPPSSGASPSSSRPACTKCTPCSWQW